NQELSPENAPLPDASFQAALLPYWDDIDETEGRVLWQETLVGGIRTLIVQWQSRPLFPDDGNGTFQLQLFETGTVLARFAYRDVNFLPGDSFGTGATIGVQLADSTAIQYSYNESSVNAGDVIEFIRVPGTIDIDEFRFDVTPEMVNVPIDFILSGQDIDLSGVAMDIVDLTTSATLTVLGPSDIADLSQENYLPATAGPYLIRLYLDQTTDYVLAIGSATSFGSDLGGRELAMGYVSDSPIELQIEQRNDPAAFVDIAASGTQLALEDDGEVTITTTVGNSLFPAGAITVGNNGGILVGSNTGLPSINSPLPTIAFLRALLPYWDDIDATRGGVYWQERLVDGIRTLIVQWDKRPLYPDTGEGSFQLQLFESGPILARYAYRDVEFGEGASYGSSATIGLQLDVETARQIGFNRTSIINGDVIDILPRDFDEFSLVASTGEIVSLATRMPSNSVAQTSAGALHPRLEVITAGGEVLASDVGSSADGTNSELTFIAPSSGQYLVRVISEGGEGAYQLYVWRDGARPVSGDFTGDGTVDGRDFLRWQRGLGTFVVPFTSSDGNGDGMVDAVDFGIWHSAWRNPLDDYADAPSAAWFISPGTALHGNLSHGDVDVFAVVGTPGREMVATAVPDGAGIIDIVVLSADGTTVVAAELDGLDASVSWLPDDGGIYYVRVEPHSSSVGEYNLTITADDYANGPVFAKLMTLPATAGGRLEAAGDSDWFRVRAVAGATYKFAAVTTIAGAELRLIDADGVTVLSADANGAPYLLSHRAASNGDLYLVIRSASEATGDYTVELQVDDHGDEASQATTFGLPGELGGEIENVGDSDWFSFMATAGHGYFIKTVLGTLADSTLTLFGTDGATQLRFDDNGSSGLASFIAWVAPSSGQYYVAVQGANASLGNYQLVVTEGDDHGDDPSVATPVLVPSTTTGDIHILGDEDWFSFEARVNRQYRIEVRLNSLTDSYLTLIGADGVALLDFDDDSGVGLGSLINWSAPSDGTYFFIVEGLGGATGTYEVLITDTGGPRRPLATASTLGDPAVIDQAIASLTRPGERMATRSVW
ncbi:MAG: pre-peptidase C-terminal domain-containing protein, partial [Planctomycetales bacterium]|nr:pre-peptidase C-terminal domain-containing protein [Planctomycetales bacterium]